MNDDAPERTLSRFLRGALLGLAATAAWLGVPAPLAASETITCAAPPLIAKIPEKDAQLGWSLSVDGRWLAAGANLDNASGTDSGAIALYLDPKPGMNPTQEIPDPEIASTDLQSNDQFGSAVSINSGWLAVGAPVGDKRVKDSGVVYLFQLVESKWVFKDKLDAADATRGARFGFSVSLNGKTLVVGAPGDSSRGSRAGAAYVFEMQGDVWEQTKLLAGDSRAFDEFGSAVATSGDKIVVGAPFADDLHVFQNFGAAYVFSKKTPNDEWTLEENGKLTAGAFRPGNIQFGSAVAIGGGRDRGRSSRG